ncbi:hypothetical protein RCL1_003543 [Eukaryota sp. TZLM3-RCL]
MFNSSPIRRKRDCNFSLRSLPRKNAHDVSLPLTLVIDRIESDHYSIGYHEKLRCEAFVRDDRLLNQGKIVAHGVSAFALMNILQEGHKYRVNHYNTSHDSSSKLIVITPKSIITPVP